MELLKIKMKLGVPGKPFKYVSHRHVCGSICTVESQVQLSNVLTWLNLEVLRFRIMLQEDAEIMNCAHTCDE